MVSMSEHADMVSQSRIFGSKAKVHNNPLPSPVYPYGHMAMQILRCLTTIGSVPYSGHSIHNLKNIAQWMKDFPVTTISDKCTCTLIKCYIYREKSESFTLGQIKIVDLFEVFSQTGRYGKYLMNA